MKTIKWIGLAVIGVLLIICALLVSSASVTVEDGEITVSQDAKVQGDIIMQSGQKICLDGIDCLAHIYYNGTGIIINASGTIDYLEDGQ